MAFTIYLSIFSAVKVEYAEHELNSCTRAMISAETNVLDEQTYVGLNAITILPKRKLTRHGGKV